MKKESIKWILFSRLMQFMVIGLVLYGGFYIFKDLYSGASFIYKTLNSIVTNPVDFIKKQNPALGTIYLMAVGIFFYNIKKYQQFWYGTTEGLFAIITCYLQFTRIQNDVSSGIINYTAGLTTITTIYLVVRGVNNIDDGYKKSFLGKFIIAYFVKSIRDDIYEFKENYREMRIELKKEFNTNKKNSADNESD